MPIVADGLWRCQDPEHRSVHGSAPGAGGSGCIILRSVPADLRPDQSRALALLMLQLHGDFRRRHGLPPLPTAWTLLEHLRDLRDRSLLTDPAVFGSRRRGLGRLIGAMRVMMWHILKPIFFRQSEVNRDLTLALEALARDHEHNLHAHAALSARLSDLEGAVARLGQRDG